MQLLQYAKAELEKAGYFSENAMFTSMAENVLALIKTFSEEGYSGWIAPTFAINLFQRLASYKPLTPLTGSVDEWFFVHSHNGVLVFQNKRQSSVFWDYDTSTDKSEVYDVDGAYVQEPDGVCYTSSYTNTPVVFPYSPPDKPKIILEGSMEHWWLSGGYKTCQR
jgi:hypothetical protein